MDLTRCNKKVSRTLSEPKDLSSEKERTETKEGNDGSRTGAVGGLAGRESRGSERRRRRHPRKSLPREGCRGNGSSQTREDDRQGRI